MVTDVYNTALRAEKEFEHLANEATGEALKVADNWGKSVLDKAHEITEEICL